MGKMTQTNLAEELAARSGVSREVADSFVCAVAEAIEKGLREDNIAKIKGLGTFKLLEVSDRGSVDVNTGERITIKGYRKVSFTPDSAMKEFVNRPFAHFEPVELNENYPTEEEELPEVEVEEKDIESTASPEPVAEKPIVDDGTESTEVAVAVSEENVTVPDEQPDEEHRQDVEPEGDNTISTSSEEQPCKKPSRRRSRVWLVAILLALLSCGAYYLSTMKDSLVGYNEMIEENEPMMVKSDLKESLNEEWREESLGTSASVTVPDTATAVQEPVSTPASSAVSLDSPKPQEKVMPESQTTAEGNFYAVTLTASLQAKSIKDITLADTTDYIIGGTLVTHKLKSGETLIQLSRKYYADKRLWPYIVKHNAMKDYNNLAIGQMVHIPILKEKE